MRSLMDDLSMFVWIGMFALAGCGGGGGGGGKSGIPGTTTSFDGPLEAMSEPITFNASGAVISYCDPGFWLCPPSSSFDERNKDMQIRIDPDADTADIDMPGWSLGSRNYTVPDVFFTDGTTTFSESRVDDLRSRILLPGMAASGFQWASHSVWSEYAPDFAFGGEIFDAGAMSFGILTKTEALPKAGVIIYTGFMSGVYVVWPLPKEAFRMSGNVSIEVDFGAGTMTGTISEITTVPLDSVSPLPFSNGKADLFAEFDRRDFTGTIDGSPFNGNLVGTFYGPSGTELGIIFEREDVAIGAISVRQ